MDTVQVNIYRQEGASPDPVNDTLLGSDTSFPGGVWEVNTTGWCEGRYTIYGRGNDLAGNASGIESRNIGVLPYPCQVSGLVEWTIGEIGNTQIGSLGA